MAQHNEDGSALALKAKLRRMSDGQLGELRRVIIDRGLGSSEPKTESSLDQQGMRDQKRP
jgi:hypothetical protein